MTENYLIIKPIVYIAYCSKILVFLTLIKAKIKSCFSVWC